MVTKGFPALPFVEAADRGATSHQEVMHIGFGKDGKGQILYDHADIALGAALAAKTAVVTASRFATNLLEDFRIIKMEVFATLNTEVLAAITEAFIFGVCDADLSSAEVEECLEAAPFDMSDVPASEQTMRAVFPLGILQSHSGGPIAVHLEKVLRWTFSNPTGWNWFVYNPSVNASGPGAADYMSLFAKIYGVWVR